MERKNNFREIRGGIIRAVSICPYCKRAKPYKRRTEDLITCVGCKRVFMCNPVEIENWMLFRDYEKLTMEEFQKESEKDRDGRGKNPNSLKNLKQNQKSKGNRK